MNQKKVYAFGAALFLLCMVHGCIIPDPDTPDPDPVLTIYGIYEASSSTAVDNGTDTGQNDRPGGALVEAYSLADNGSQTLVAGGARSITTNDQGMFTIILFKAVKNLIIKIINDGDEEKCVLAGVRHEEHQSETVRGWPGRPVFQTADNGTDNATEYAVVSPETDVEADIVLSEVSRNGTPPSEVNTQGIDEIIDPDIAREIRDNPAVRECVISMLEKGRKDSQDLFVSVLEDPKLNQQSMDNASRIIRDALVRIEGLRKELRKNIYEIKKAGGDVQAQLQVLQNQQRQQVLDILNEAGIPPQLYMKGNLISQSYFRSTIFKIGPTCAVGELTLGNMLIRRALIRKVQDDAMQEKTLLKNVFGYDNTTAIDEGVKKFQNTLMSLDPAQDAGPAHRSAVSDFHEILIRKILIACDERLVSDNAIMSVLEAMRQSGPLLNQEVEAAQSPEEVETAFVNYLDRFRSTIKQKIPILPNEPEEIAKKKRVLVDLLFSIGTR